MERRFAPYTSVTGCLAQTGVLGYLSYRLILAPRKQFLGVWLAVGTTLAAYLSAETTYEVIHSRMTLPAFEANGNGKPS